MHFSEGPVVITHRFGDLELGFVRGAVRPPEGFRLLPGVVEEEDWVMCVRDATDNGLVASPIRVDFVPKFPFNTGDPVPPQGYRTLSRISLLPEYKLGQLG